MDGMKIYPPEIEPAGHRDILVLYYKDLYDDGVKRKTFGAGFYLHENKQWIVGTLPACDIVPVRDVIVWQYVNWDGYDE